MYQKGQYIRLSICIPTYNRPDELRRLLRSIARQSSDGVEIIIGNDGDEDDLSDVLYELDTCRVTYVQNSQRIGFSRNLLAVTQKAQGEYIWWIGDDDEVGEGAIAHVLRCIEEKPDLIWVNVRSSISSIPYITRSQEGFLKDSEEALETIGRLLTFISSTVCRKDKIPSPDEKDMILFSDSIFINFAIILCILSRGGRCYYVTIPYTIAHWTLPGESWHNTFKTFSTDFLHVLHHFQGNFSLRGRRAITRDMFGFCWRVLLVEWARGHSSPRFAIGSMLRNYWSYPEIFIAIPLFLLPRSVIRICYRTYSLRGLSRFLHDNGLF